MNLPTLPPYLGHQPPRRRIVRDIAGLLLVSTGTVGLLGALYVTVPLAALALAGVILTVGGIGVLSIRPPLHPAIRLIGGFGALAVGSWIFVGIAVYLTPWTLLFGLLLALGVFLSGEEA
ncbi:hypothetical protein [Streptomyces sp. NPDC097619]|uniref:hypothetical protein n=1 Tax=Streptomyces sp. NPDC097619 TaxID=3157228 RepID=UPI003333C7FA